MRVTGRKARGFTRPLIWGSITAMREIYCARLAARTIDSAFKIGLGKHHHPPQTLGGPHVHEDQKVHKPPGLCANVVRAHEFDSVLTVFY
jgi:hypothetical protein